jgi:hypothetical protein
LREEVLPELALGGYTERLIKLQCQFLSSFPSTPRMDLLSEVVSSIAGEGDKLLWCCLKSNRILSQHTREEGRGPKFR